MPNNKKNFETDEAMIYASYHNLTVKVLKKNRSILTDKVRLKSFSNACSNKQFDEFNLVSFVFNEDTVPPGYDFVKMKFRKLVNLIIDYCEYFGEKRHDYFVNYYYLYEWFYNIDALWEMTRKNLDPLIPVMECYKFLLK